MAGGTMDRDTADRDTGRARPWYFWPIIAFVGGLLFGWLIIGWGVWPVTWRNALPEDLKAEQKYDYLTMVAESYAATGDLQLAQSRVAGWPQEDLATALNQLQENYASTNAAKASDVQLLASALSVSEGAGAAPVQQATAAPAQPTRVPANGATRSTAASIITALLWFILAVGAIALFVYLFMRWQAAQQGRPAPDFRESLRSFGRRGMAEQTAAEVAAEEKARWATAPATQAAYDDLDAASRGESPRTYPRSSYDDQQADLYPEDQAIQGDLASQPREERLPPVVYPEPDEGWSETTQVEPPPASAPRRAPAPTAAVPAIVRAASGDKLGDFVAIYEMGESDYDEAFDINDPVDGLIGQCGLQLNEPVGRNRDQAVALQAWLWDSSDPDTRVKVLMSEGAYRDTALRAQQVTEHEAFPVRQGTEFELESHDLLMKGRVEKVDYADQEPSRSVFAQIQVRLQVFRKN